MQQCCTVWLLLHSWKWIKSSNFCKMNCKLSLYTHICRIYIYIVNVYKNFVQAMFERLKKK